MTGLSSTHDAVRPPLPLSPWHQAKGHLIAHLSEAWAYRRTHTRPCAPAAGSGATAASSTRKHPPTHPDAHTCICAPTYTPAQRHARTHANQPPAHTQGHGDADFAAVFAVLAHPSRFASHPSHDSRVYPSRIAESIPTEAKGAVTSRGDEEPESADRDSDRLHLTRIG